MQERTNTPTIEGNSPTTENAGAQKIAENSNPRANENIKHAPFDEKESGAGNAVGTEITDGEAG